MLMLRLGRLLTMPSPLQDTRIIIIIQFQASLAKVDDFDDRDDVPGIIEKADIAHVPPDLHSAVDGALADYGPCLHRIQQEP